MRIRRPILNYFVAYCLFLTISGCGRERCENEYLFVIDIASSDYMETVSVGDKIEFDLEIPETMTNQLDGEGNLILTFGTTEDLYHFNLGFRVDLLDSTLEIDANTHHSVLVSSMDNTLDEFFQEGEIRDYIIRPGNSTSGRNASWTIEFTLPGLYSIAFDPINIRDVAIDFNCLEDADLDYHINGQFQSNVHIFDSIENEFMRGVFEAQVENGHSYYGIRVSE